MLKMTLRILIFSFACPVAMVHGDMLIWQNGNSAKRLYGLVERDEPGVVHFRMHPDLGGELRVIPRDEILTLVFHADASRLMELKPGSLADYRDYGEELASQADDLQARDLAIRLFLIVAYGAGERPLQPNARQLRASALRNLLPLARDDAERRAFEQLAVLYGLSERAPNGSTAPLRAEITEEMRAKLLDLLLAVRAGDREGAQRLLQQPDVEQAWQTVSLVCPWDELSRIIQQGEPLAFQLQRLLTIELELRKRRQVGAMPRTKVDSWAVQAREHEPQAEWLPNLLDLTEYDPRQNVWCNGQWIRQAK